MPPEFRSLPPLGSRERLALIERLATAFGDPKPGAGAVNAAAVYDELSQLSYHDRITILHQTFRHQRVPAFINPQFDDPETAVRMYLFNRMVRGTDGRPTYAGVDRFFNLVADAPRDTAYQERLAGEMYEVRQVLIPAGFADRDNEGFQARINTFSTFNHRTSNPFQTLRSVGITPGNPPYRATPLRQVDGPQYQALPSLNSRDGRNLVAQLVRQAGPIHNRDGQFIGFADPAAVFNTLARYDYASRLTLYRAVLTEQDRPDIAEMDEESLRRHLMNRFLHNAERQTSFAGMDRFLRLVADAPRDGRHTGYLRSEIETLVVDTDHSQFTDKNDPAVQDRYQRFFSIGGHNRDLLPNDPYMRLELARIPVGRQPVVYVAPTTPAPAPAPAPLPAPAPTSSRLITPFRLENVGSFPTPAIVTGLGDWEHQSLLASEGPWRETEPSNLTRVAVPSVVSL